MSTTGLLPTPLAATLLRRLSLKPRRHPRGQPHLSAASGLVCAHQRAYVIADDEHHLAVFRDHHSPGELHRLLDGDLPRPKAARKRRKPDLETLLLLPPSRAAAGGTLLALGSGSRPNRNRALMIPLRADGEVAEMGAPPHGFSLEGLYGPLRAQLGEINIEGALLLGDQLVLLNRAVPGGSGNAAVHCGLHEFLELAHGKRRTLHPASIRPYALGSLAGVPLAFTDGTALPSGGWLFSAVAEQAPNSYADGPCSGSVIGVVNRHGDLLALHQLGPQLKVEGIAAQRQGNTLALCMVTDADDPAQASQLWLAHLDELGSLKGVWGQVFNIKSRNQQPSTATCNGLAPAASVTTNTTRRGLAAPAVAAAASSNENCCGAAPTLQATTGWYCVTTWSCSKVSPAFSPARTRVAWPSSRTAQ
jgi:hypothetical protein